MSAISIHYSSELAAGPGADPQSGHREGRLKNGSRAQVTDTDTHMHSPWNTNREGDRHPVNISLTLCASSGCALWTE